MNSRTLIFNGELHGLSFSSLVVVVVGVDRNLIPLFVEVLRYIIQN
jgi:hypothetical protein